MRRSRSGPHRDTPTTSPATASTKHARDATQLSSDRRQPAAPGRPRILTDDHLRHVAAVYDKAWRRGDNPTRAVAEDLTITRSAAAKQVARARAAGYLPPAQRGKARGNPAS